jgi:hypothetical protein
MANAIICATHQLLPPRTLVGTTGTLFLRNLPLPCCYTSLTHTYTHTHITSELLNARHAAPSVLVLDHGDVAARDVLHSAVEQRIYILLGSDEARTMEARGTFSAAVTRTAVGRAVRS